MVKSRSVKRNAKNARGRGETSLRSKRFRLVSKQRKTERRGLSVLTAREMKRVKEGGGGGEGLFGFIEISP